MKKIILSIAVGLFLGFFDTVNAAGFASIESKEPLDITKAHTVNALLASWCAEDESCKERRHADAEAFFANLLYLATHRFIPDTIEGDNIPTAEEQRRNAEQNAQYITRKNKLASFSEEEQKISAQFFNSYVRNAKVSYMPYKLFSARILGDLPSPKYREDMIHALFAIATNPRTDGSTIILQNSAARSLKDASVDPKIVALACLSIERRAVDLPSLYDQAKRMTSTLLKSLPEEAVTAAKRTFEREPHKLRDMAAIPDHHHLSESASAASASASTGISPPASPKGSRK